MSWTVVDSGTPSSLLTISASGLSVSVRNPRSESNPFPNRQARTTTRSFGKSAQASLKKLFRSLDWGPYFSTMKSEPEARGFFATLTVPQGQDVNQAAFKKLKDSLRIRILREYGDVFEGAVWKAERQSGTGTPHLHLILLFGETQKTEKVLAWLTEAWASLVDCYDGDFIRHSIDVRTLYGSHLRLRSYLLKQPVTAGQT